MNIPPYVKYIVAGAVAAFDIIWMGWGIGHITFENVVGCNFIGLLVVTVLN